MNMLSQAHHVLATIKQVVLQHDEQLLKSPWKTGDRRPFQGHCYVVSEALYHLLGGKEAGLTPVVVRHENTTHWWVRDAAGNIYDGTQEQFTTPVPYEQGRGCGFQGKPGQPSKRAAFVIERVRQLL
jgi:hypothetical protein